MSQKDKEINTLNKLKSFFFRDKNASGKWVVCAVNVHVRQLLLIVAVSDTVLQEALVSIESTQICCVN